MHRSQPPDPVLLDRAVADLARVAPEELTPQVRLVEDLGLDSLALAELAVVLLELHGVEDFGERPMDGVTLGDLHTLIGVA